MPSGLGSSHRKTRVTRRRNVRGAVANGESDSETALSRLEAERLGQEIRPMGAEAMRTALARSAVHIHRVLHVREYCHRLSAKGGSGQ